MVGIELRGVTKTFDTPTGPLHAVNDVWLCVEEGSIHGIIGLSGAGKSTLLRLINLIERPDSGEVVVDGRELTGLSEEEVRHARRGIGMIFQHFNLLANRTALDNVALPLAIAGVAKREQRQIAIDRLETVGLPHKRDAYPAKLSGGEKQRVAIARALATQPRILLCDEPTSSVDPQTKGTILGYLREINRRFGITIVLVTHEMSVVRAVCDVVTVLDRGRSVEQFAPNDHLHRPRSAIASFLARSEIVLEPLGDDASVAVAGGE
ncbi:MAG: ATP-binding cassette domain-containing protein [Chloroflexi bacterium]|nr:MAG: ATP-binding cassette domain-containing protein [Chloroflexota bacterium]